MPDRDLLRNGIPRRWQKAYLQLCERRLPDEEIAQSMLRCLHEDVRRYGKAPLHYLDEIAKVLAVLGTQPLLNTPLDWLELDNRIECQAQQLRVPPVAADAAERACEEIRDQVHAGKVPSGIEGLRRALYEEYQRKLIGNFEGRVSLVEQHHAGTSRKLVEQRLAALGPHIEEAITKQAAKLVKNHDALNTMRLPRLRVDRHIDAKTQVPIMIALDEAS